MSNAMYVVAALLDKMSNPDPDFRFMAVNDLMSELAGDKIAVDEQTERKLSAAVLKLLGDKNSEVQNIAVKCLAPICKKVREKQLLDVVDQLCEFMATGKEDALRDVAGLGLKTVVMELPRVSAPAVVKRLIPRLADQLKLDKQTVQMDALEILIETLARYGALVAADAARVQGMLCAVLDHQRPAIRKKATQALGHLVAHSKASVFESLAKQAMKELGALEATSEFEKLRTWVNLVATLSRSSPRGAEYLDKWTPMLIKITDSEDDELKENCLQALETLAQQSPKQFAAKSVISLALQYVKYDPNYDVGSEDDASMEEDDDEEEEDEDDDLDYSDDDDASWKVRKAAARLLGSIIAAHGEAMPEYYDAVAPALVKRLSEREESVRLDVVATLTTLVRLTAAAEDIGYAYREAGGESAAAAAPAAKGGRRSRGSASKKMKIDDANKMDMDEIRPKQRLWELVPLLCKAGRKQLEGKSLMTKQHVFELFREVVGVFKGDQKLDYKFFAAAVKASTSGSGPGTGLKKQDAATQVNLKIEVLHFLQTGLRHDGFQNYDAGELLKLMQKSLDDPFYKIVVETLKVLIELVPRLQTPFPALLKDVVSRVDGDIDFEVKERAIACLGVCLAHSTAWLSPQESAAVWKVLTDRLRNEVTRLATIKALADVLAAEHARGLDVVPVQVVPPVMEELLACTRQASRALRNACLGALSLMLRRAKRLGAPLDAAFSANALDALSSILGNDQHELFIILGNLTTFVAEFIGAADAATVTAFADRVLENLVHLLIKYANTNLTFRNGEYAGLKDYSAVERFFGCWETLVGVLGEPFFAAWRDKLMNVDETITVQALFLIAQAIHRMCGSDAVAAAQKKKTVQELVKMMETPAGDKKGEKLKMLALLVVGEIGQEANIAKIDGKIVPKLMRIISSNESDEITQTAATALGGVAIGNTGDVLPALLNELSKDDLAMKHAVLLALEKVISNELGRVERTEINLDELWQALFAHGLESAAGGAAARDSQRSEAIRALVSEVVGKLSRLNPGVFLPELETRMKSDDPLVRATIMNAIRFTFTDQQLQHEQAKTTAEYDRMLQQFMLTFLELMRDGDLTVKRITLSTLNSAAHNKPYLIKFQLPAIMPLVYESVEVHEELIRTVVMGPFKHQVDDGLDIRKSAYEVLLTLLETCGAELDTAELVEKLLTKGLRDPASEIVLLAHHTLQKLAGLRDGKAVRALLVRVGELVEPLSAAMLVKCKPNAVKQEVEKNNEVVKSAARTAVAVQTQLVDRMRRAEGSGMDAAVGTGAAGSVAEGVAAFEAFVREFPGANELEPVFASVRAELAETQHV